MKAVYANLPGVRVEALRFAPRDISGERLLAMMKVDENNREFIFLFPHSYSYTILTRYFLQRCRYIWS